MKIHQAIYPWAVLLFASFMGTLSISLGVIWILANSDIRFHCQMDRFGIEIVHPVRRSLYLSWCDGYTMTSTGPDGGSWQFAPYYKARDGSVIAGRRLCPRLRMQ